jgi:hypothetical protein
MWTGLVLGVAACGDDVTVPPPAIVVTVTPDGAEIAIGGTLQMAATATGGPGGAPTFTWASSNNATATVSNTGLVTGVAAGSVGITATATIGSSTGAGSATVNVVSTDPELPPTVSIATITNTTPAGEVPVNLGAVAGQINVTVNLERNNNQIQSLELLMKNSAGADSVVASQSFGGSAPVAASAELVPEQIQFSVNTAAFNATTGSPAFTNGPNGVTVRAIGSAGTPTASNAVQFILSNSDVAVVTLTTSTPETAAGPGGVFWQTGDLVATAVVVKYSSSGTVQFVTFDPSDGLDEVTDDTAPFTATWAKGTAQPAGTEGFEDDVTVSVTSAVGGAAGPSGSASLNLDNLAPSAGTFDLTVQGVSGTGVQTACCVDDWVGADYAFEDGYTAGTDGGVGGVTGTFFALRPIPAGTDADDIVADGDEVSTGADLGDETATNAEIAMAVSECDALENCINTAKSGSGRVGVDVTAPEISFAAGTVAADDITNVAADVNFVLSVDEEGSGVSPTPALVLATGNFVTASFTAANCVAPSILSGSSCRAGASDLTPTIAAADAADKYVTTVITVWDRAGNLSNELSRTVLHDATAPTIPNAFNAPAAELAGGASTTFSAAVADNRDLGGGDLLIDGIPVAAEAQLGTYGEPLTTTGNLSVTAPWIRSIATFASGAAGALTTTATLRVFDVAGNFATRNAGGVLSVGTPAAVGTGGTEFIIADGPDDLCSTEANCVAANQWPTSGNVTIRVRGPAQPTTFANPFANGGYMILLFEDGVGNQHFVAKVTAPSSSPTDAVNKDYIYTIPFSALGLDAIKFGLANGASVTLTAVGVTAAGDAVMSATFSVNIWQD